MSAHLLLRQRTRAAHDRVDAAFSRFELADADSYRGFLIDQAAAFLPAEAALIEAGAGQLIDGFAAQCRAPALLADLAELGATPPPPIAPPAYSTPAAIWGGAYVLEGSRLGGAMLRRQVAAGLPRRFLDSVQPPGRWRNFLASLERNLFRPEDLDAAIGAATATFAMFERVGQKSE